MEGITREDLEALRDLKDLEVFLRNNGGDGESAGVFLPKMWLADFIRIHRLPTKDEAESAYWAMMANKLTSEEDQNEKPN